MSEEGEVDVGLNLAMESTITLVEKKKMKSEFWKYFTFCNRIRQTSV